MRKANSASVSTLAFRLTGLALLAGVAGCSSDVHRIEMPWSVPVASNTTNDYQNDATGSIGKASSFKPQGIAPVAAAPLSNPSWNTASNKQPSQPLISQGSQSITVGQGDTVYGIARRYEVPVGTLMVMNNITSATDVKPGQVLQLPASAALAKPQSFAASAPSKVEPLIASKAPVLAKLPSSAKAAVTNKAVANVKDAPILGLEKAKTASAEKLTQVATTAAPHITPTKVAAIEPVKIAESKATAKVADEKAMAKSDVTASLPDPSAMSSTDFRWPVRGRVVQNFGPIQGGGRNDGINIVVPAGTPVKAAENGVVAYAGSELKGYGNLILIRHDNDFVTAYAHNADIKVKRGDKVTRGQIIGSAGQSGNVTQPQLHFEIRKGSSPIDPMTRLAGN